MVEVLIMAEKQVKMEESQMAGNTQAIGANVSMWRTMTPAKYQSRVP